MFFPLSISNFSPFHHSPDEPGAPSIPEIVDYDNKMVVLNWKPPSEDGGRPITHYVIELKDKLSAVWTECAKTADASTEIQVNGLKENMTYQFRVRAVNKAGMGEPSLPTGNHLCKHKNRESPFHFSIIYKSRDISR